jgi:hypothetical protein
MARVEKVGERSRVLYEITAGDVRLILNPRETNRDGLDLFIAKQKIQLHWERKILPKRDVKMDTGCWERLTIEKFIKVLIPAVDQLAITGSTERTAALASETWRRRDAVESLQATLAEMVRELAAIMGVDR